METTHSAAFLKQRKFLMALPLLILPFLTLGFYALGGGKGYDPNNLPVKKGLNLALPDADFKDERAQDKMSLYDLADKDAVKVQRSDSTKLATSTTPDPQEAAIQQKLAQLKTEINKQPAATPATTVQQPDPGMSKDVAKLEAMMKAMQQQGGNDPEMVQLNSMMDKIMAIQNPGLVKEKLKAVAAAAPDSIYKAIPAVIVDNQKVTQGTTIKLQLKDTLILKGQVIPKGQFIFGTCDIQNQRLFLNIRNIRLGTSILPVDLSVYDMDGMEGINVPEALTKDAVNSGADDAIRSMQLMSMDQSLTTQAAGVGIEAAKGLFSKKVKRIKVKLKAGHSILLRDNKPVNPIR
jgi:hypothetical protein